MSGSARGGVDLRAVRALARRDVQVVLRTRAVVLPLILVPALIQVIIPLALIALVRFAGDGGALDLAGDLEPLLAALPDGVRADLDRLDPSGRALALALGRLFAPLMLIVPLMVASVIAADAFAGEKERGTLEALLHAPVRARDLFLGKLLAAWVPAVAVGLAGTAAYAVVVTVAAWPLTGGPFLPASVWLPLALFVGPAVALAGLGATVVVSARVRTFQEAYQLGGIVVLPVVGLVVAQATGAAVLDARAMLWIGAAAWTAAAALLAFGLRTFHRERLALDL